MEATCSSLSLSGGTQHPEGIEQLVQYKTHSNRTLSGMSTYRVCDITSIHTYVFIRTRLPQKSVAIKHMCEQCIPGALSPPLPPRLRTRLRICTASPKTGPRGSYGNRGRGHVSFIATQMLASLLSH